jgi:hypothetical protein
MKKYFTLIFSGIILFVCTGCGTPLGSDADGFNELLDKSDSYQIIIRSFNVDEYDIEVSRATGFLGEPSNIYNSRELYSSSSSYTVTDSADIVLLRDTNDKWPILLIEKRVYYYGSHNNIWRELDQTVYYIKNRSVKEVYKYFLRKP